MLSYRHAFHAGNFADVLKHLVLLRALEALRRKDKPFFALDTHGGAGLYDLQAAAASRNREFETGIAALASGAGPPPEVEAYLCLVRQANGGSPALKRYPGSPWFIRARLRERDRLLVCERHPAEAPALRAALAGDPRVEVQAGDGYAALARALPPRERRGLVLIDPAFEQPGELQRMDRALREAAARWATGVYLLWYPLTQRLPVARWQRELAESGPERLLAVELSVLPADHPVGLNGSGVLVVNPPWRLDAELRELLPWVWRTLDPAGRGGWRVEWLRGEES